ncbi:Si-specific NAD(P)(+) transhydrogenase [Limnoglobus roseus]|uniref:Soluble pyridine nucleotide transhydrogenase n=2 Tax=Limnoglobus roseus TaxID=2598579 RepID=A0A5C1A4Y6_9BACT|nr:Si-specific NAD(P)(+) transhydrogenase [Limnoglobus roseus]
MPDGESFDLIVIGAGPGGEMGALRTAILGKRVAVVEKEAEPGGASVNTGTVPSKTLRETALALSGLRSRDLYGVDLSIRRGATVDDFLHHERQVRQSEHSRIRGLFEKFGVTVFHGRGEFADPHTVTVHQPDGTTRTLHGENILIATGSVPIRPAEIPFDHNRIHDSDELLNIHELPRSIAVIGAGVIGCEYACMFAALGVETYLIDGREKLLPQLDAEISASLAKAMRALGVQLVLGRAVERFPPPSDGDIELTLSGGTPVHVHHVLFCAGRMCRTPDLKPELAGVQLAEKNRVPVNEHFQTNVPHIYAVGDVIGFPALASTSAEQGRAAAIHMFDNRHPEYAVAQVLPAGIYTIPELSCAGATEDELKAKGVEYAVGRAEYAEVARGKIIGDGSGFLKLLFDKQTRKLLGVHVIGEHATEVVHIGVMAMMTEAGVDLFLRTCFNYPTLGELYKLAALRADFFGLS